MISSTFLTCRRTRDKADSQGALQVDWASSEDDPDSGKTFKHRFRGSLIKIFEAAEMKLCPLLDAEICCHSVQRDVERADQRMGSRTNRFELVPDTAQSCERSSCMEHARKICQPSHLTCAERGVKAGKAVTDSAAAMGHLIKIFVF